MDTVKQAAIIGIDISRDWLDVHCLPGGNRARFPNKVKGHERLVAELGRTVLRRDHVETHRKRPA